MVRSIHIMASADARPDLKSTVRSKRAELTCMRPPHVKNPPFRQRVNDPAT